MEHQVAFALHHAKCAHEACLHTRFYPDGATIFELELDTTTPVRASLGPFDITVTKAAIEVFLNPPASRQALNFSGSLDVTVDFPFFGPHVTLGANFTFPLTTAAPLVLSLDVEAGPSTFGFGLHGAYQHFGLYNPNNMGFLSLTVPGLTGFKSDTAAP